MLITKQTKYYNLLTLGTNSTKFFNFSWLFQIVELLLYIFKLNYPFLKKKTAEKCKIFNPRKKTSKYALRHLLQ